MGERSSVKKSVIGSHVTIGKGVVISRSVVMDYVDLADKYALTQIFPDSVFSRGMVLFHGIMFNLFFLCSVKLEGCVVCTGAKVLDRSNLKDSEVAGGVVVPRDSKLNGFLFPSVFTDSSVFVCLLMPFTPFLQQRGRASVMMGLWGVCDG